MLLQTVTPFALSATSDLQEHASLDSREIVESQGHKIIVIFSPKLKRPINSMSYTCQIKKRPRCVDRYDID